MEASPRSPLRLLVNPETGETTHTCPSCDVKDQAIERLTRSYEGTIRNLREQLDERKASEADFDPMVIEVVEDWCRKAEVSGWWRNAHVTEPRLEATRAAVNRKLAPGYLMTVNTGAFASADSQKRNRSFQRAWLEPATIYGKFVDAHYQTGIDPSNERVRKLFEVPKVLVERWEFIVEPLAFVCDHCGHIAADHDKPSIANEFAIDPVCLVHGCDCPGFDDTFFRADQWMAARAPKPRFRS